MEEKGKRAKITPNGYKIIIKRSLELPRIKRTLLAETLQAELKNKGEDVPEIEVLERKISWYRRHWTDDLQDKPWRLTTLDDYPIPPEALPKVLEIFVDRLLSEEVYLSIREAKWIARLSFVLKDPKTLYMAALEYADAEKCAQLQGFDLDELVDDTLLCEDIRQEMKKALSPDEIKSLRERIRAELSRHKQKGGKK